MKRFLTLLIVLCLALSLVACGSAETPKETAGAQYSAADNFSFTYKGTEITLHTPAAAIVSALGEPTKYSESTSCAFEGLDKSYYYGSFYLETYPKGEEDFVYGWWFADDSVATAEGIRIGDSRDDLMEVYGEPTSSSEKILLYEAKGMYLKFIMNAGGTRISQIQYMHPDAID